MSEDREPAKAGTREGKKVRGFGLLPCPCCGEENIIRVGLSDLEHFRCVGCRCQFDRESVESFIERWQAVLAWIDTAPHAIRHHHRRKEEQ
jgi:hypothetical protein